MKASAVPSYSVYCNESWTKELVEFLSKGSRAAAMAPMVRRSIYAFVCIKPPAQAGFVWDHIKERSRAMQAGALHLLKVVYGELILVNPARFSAHTARSNKRGNWLME